MNDVPRLLAEVDRLLSYTTRADALSNAYTVESVSDDEIDLDDWGAWRYDPEANTLFLNPERMPHLDPTYCRSYAIRLDECGTSAGMLDWIFHVAGKDWCTPGVLASMIEALDTLINPQANLCSFREDQPMDDVRATIRMNRFRRKGQRGGPFGDAGIPQRFLE